MSALIHEVSDEQWLRFQEKFKAKEFDETHPAYLPLVRGYYKTRLLAFAKVCFEGHMRDPQTNELIPFSSFHAELEALLTDDTNFRLGIAAPRNHAKSTVVTFFYVLWCALFKKKKNIVIISSSEDMAIRFLRRIKEELEFNSMLHYLFGMQKAEKWSETEIILANGVVIHARGRGAQLRGLISGANRPDLIICDDIEDDELVRSEIRRQDLESWFNGTVMPTLTPRVGQLVLIGTILHQDSLLNNVLTKYNEFKTAKFAALLPNDEPLWPERFSQADLHKIREDLTARGQLEKFYMEYMNDPVPQEAAIFDLKTFRFYDPNALPAKHDLVYEMAIDLGGGSTRVSADDTAFVVTATDKYNNVYVIDVFSDTMGTDTDRIIEVLFSLYDAHAPQTIIVEKTTATNFLISTLEREQLKRNAYLPLKFVNPPRGQGGRKGNMTDAKFQRIAALAPQVRAGVLMFLPSQQKILSQAASFPRSKHDDILDALAYIWMFGHRSIEMTANQDEDDYSYQPLYPEIGL